MSYRARLLALKKRCVRRGIWFRVLNRLERAQVDLTFKVVTQVRSALLARVLRNISGKLSSALQSRVLKAIKNVGIPLTHKISSIAKGWGHKSAESWAEDMKFARFLAIMNLNTRG
jgi:hypothetical protein